MSISESHKQLAYAIIEYFQQTIEKNIIKEDDHESIEVAIQSIGEAFGVDVENEENKKYSIKPASLINIFEVFLKTQKKKEVPKEIEAEAKLKAEELKSQGNQKLTEKKFQEAADLYGQAINLDPSNPVYFSNRAAAYIQLGEFDKAIEDSEKALQVNSKYTKAYSRLGHAYYSLGKYKEAQEAYQKGLEMDPNNEVLKSALKTCQNKMTSSTPGGAGAGAASGGTRGGAPGGFDFASLMNNPAIMNMASQLMGSGALNNIMNNPQFAQMAQNMMGNEGSAGAGAGGMEGLLNNPDLRSAAQNLMRENPDLASNIASLGGANKPTAEGTGEQKQ